MFGKQKISTPFLILSFIFIVVSCSRKNETGYSLKTNSELKELLTIAFNNCTDGDSLIFKRTNKLLLINARELNDSMSISEAHWNYGLFYGEREKLDSAYYHYFQAYNYYEALNHDYYKSKMLFNMAFIQGRLKDYWSAEEKLVRAVKSYQKLSKYKSLYLSYKLLGNILREKKEFDKAIDYHKISLEQLAEIEDKGTFYENSFNAIGLVYQEKNNQNEAIKYFVKGLNNKNLKNENIKLYAILASRDSKM